MFKLLMWLRIPGAILCNAHDRFLIVVGEEWGTMCATLRFLEEGNTIK